MSQMKRLQKAIPRQSVASRLWLLLVLLFTLQVPSTSAAAEGTELKKVGEARLRVFLWSIYNSRLYTPSGTYREGERPLRLEIEYLINVRRGALVERTGDEWDAMGRNHPEQEAWLTRLDELWPDIRKRDVLSIELDSENRSTFYFNGTRLGRIDDPDFGPQFLDIWLSEDSSRPELREELLGASEAN